MGEDTGCPLQKHKSHEKHAHSPFHSVCPSPLTLCPQNLWLYAPWHKEWMDFFYLFSLRYIFNRVSVLVYPICVYAHEGQRFWVSCNWSHLSSSFSASFEENILNIIVCVFFIQSLLLLLLLLISRLCGLGWP